MTMTDRTQAILLLTAHLGHESKDDPKPFSPSEWGRFAQWLMERGADPETLLVGRTESVLEGWNDPRISVDRIEFLLHRSSALALLQEKWERAGLWVLTRGDPEYPARLKRLLRNESPPVLFGSGNRRLLDGGGVAVVGSRDADDADLAFSRRLGATAAEQGWSVISGGARGVDEAALLGALSHEGTAVGVLADGLLRATTSAQYRASLMGKGLVLISPFNPEAGFSVGNAMARNKYIYCLADAAVVVATAQGKGGTWSGAVENLSHQWVPLWIKRSESKASGVQALVARGARWLAEENLHVASLWTVPAPNATSGATAEGKPAEAWTLPPSSAVQPEALAAPTRDAVRDGEGVRSDSAEHETGGSFYALFLSHAEALTAQGPVTTEQLLQSMGIHKAQLAQWLEQAVSEGRLRRLNRPLRYVWVPEAARQHPLFESSAA